MYLGEVEIHNNRSVSNSIKALPIVVSYTAIVSKVLNYLHLQEQVGGSDKATVAAS